MPTPNRSFGTPMHLHDRFYGGVLVALLHDLKGLASTNIGSRCGTIRAVLDDIHSAYNQLGDGILLRKELLPELDAFRRFYAEWNDASETDIRRDRVFLMRKAKERIQELINRDQVIFETEIDRKFTESLYARVGALRSLASDLPEVAKTLTRAERGHLAASSLQKTPPIQPLDPVHEFRLCVRRLCGKKFETVHSAALDDWSRKNLGGLSQDNLRNFRAGFAKEFKLAFEHYPPRLNQLPELLTRCSALLERILKGR